MSPLFEGGFEAFIQRAKHLVLMFMLLSVSFGLLYYNASRVDLSEVASLAVQAGSNRDGQFVYLTDTLKAEHPIEDSYLKPGSYLALERKVEVYAWVEVDKQDYEKRWTTEPKPFSAVQTFFGRENPSLPIPQSTLVPISVSIGGYGVNSSLLFLPEKQTVELNDTIVLLEPDMQRVGNYIFQGKGSLDEPEIGDMRLSYLAYNSPSPQVTILAKQEGDSLKPYFYAKGESLYKVWEGDIHTVVNQLRGFHEALNYIIAFASFIVFWFGIHVFFDTFFPLLGAQAYWADMSRFRAFVLTLFCSVGFVAGFIGLAGLICNIFVLLLYTLVYLGGLLFYVHRQGV